ncbi:Protein of unknown function [Gryllus bimaculatus]|nr:Protein of unknown function [Gryllus bimaculatus]
MTRMDNSSGSVKSFDLEKAEQQKVIRQAQPVKSHAVGIICLQSTQRAEFLLCKELCGREASVVTRPAPPPRPDVPRRRFSQLATATAPGATAAAVASPLAATPATLYHRLRESVSDAKVSAGTGSGSSGARARQGVRWCGCSRGRRRRRAT